ncbi:pVI [Red-eared slider adenovirus 1]|uniref:pVI n=1 Tax=Red-eared slider adenovirus 1 TaxID=2749458 RepID=UPI002481AADE|nr:pVI [Red-eared slider adenovirus 1]QLD29005.1 pVI [Red-eared slider adenovirus 1]
MGAFANMSPTLGNNTISAWMGPAYPSDPYGGVMQMSGGGIWGNLANSFKSSLSSFGKTLSTGFNYGVQGLRQFGNSDTWRDIKAGVKESGVLQNLGQIGAQSINTLIDVANMKAQMGLEQVKRDVLGLPDPYENDPWGRWQMLSAQAIQEGRPPPVPPRAPPRGSKRPATEDNVYDTIPDGVYENVTEEETYLNTGPQAAKHRPLPPPPTIPLPARPDEVRPRPSIPESPYFNDVYELDPKEFEDGGGYEPTVAINPLAGMGGPRWKRALRQMTGGLARKRRRYCH